MSENQKTDGLKIALPNGSLEDGTTRLFREATLEIEKDSRRHEVRINSPLISQGAIMRPQHTPLLVEKGTFDVGICGWDSVCESEAKVSMVAKLLYGRGTSDGQAKVVLVTSNENPVTKVSEIPKDAVILSEYPSITRKVLGPSVDIRFSYGSTEAHIPEHYEYGVCRTDTGKSLKANGLKVVVVFLESYTCLIANISAMNGDKAEAIKTLERLLKGTLEAREKVLLKMNVSAEKKYAVLAVLPSLQAPTVSPLSDGSSFAIETVVRKDTANEVIIKAAKAGAEGILELPITKVIQDW